MKKIFLSSIFFVLLTLVGAKNVWAGTNLTLTCATNGPCTIAPTNTPLFDETNLAPGMTRTQNMTIINNDQLNTCNLLLTATDKTTGELSLAPRMFAAIASGGINYFGVVSANQATSSQTYASLYTTPNIPLGSLAPGTSRTYNWYATFDPTAGNEYQGIATIFDLNVNITCTTGNATPTPAPGSSGGSGGGGGGGGGSVFGATSPAQPPVCNDNAPSSAPTVTIVSAGPNTVTLSWTAVSPVTHYGLFFTRTSDNTQYGAPDIGNVTTYTVNNLAGGANYSFQVFGVNGCAPGPRSNNATTAKIAGGPTTGRPVGGNGQVLGTSVTVSPAPTPSSSPSPSPSPSILGQVEGASTSICTNWRQYIPWILLVIQFFFILFFEFRFRGDSGWTKHFLAVGMTLLSIIIFYLVRECNCYGEWSWLGWLCKWYWVVSILLTLLIKGFSYAFLDESVEKEVPPKQQKPPVVPPATSATSTTSTTPETKPPTP